MSEVVSLLSRLVAFPTISSRENTALAAFVAERLESLGMRVERLESAVGKVNLIASAGPQGTDGLILSGHMDVVPVEGQAWTGDPFVLRELVDGRLVARGATDMKGFLADVLVALQRINLSKLKRELVLLWTADEEIGCLGSAALAKSFLASGRVLPKQALIGEPTSFRIFRMHNGHAAMRLVATGVDGHSSKPDLGANAILIAAHALRALEELAREFQKEQLFVDELERPYVVFSPGMIQGGTAVNVIPSRCEVLVGFRPLPGQDAAEIVQRVRAHMEAETLPYAQSLHPEASVSVVLERVSPSMLTRTGTPLEAALTSFAVSPKPAGCPFCTDAGNFQSLGIESLVFGPGSIDQAHRPDEFILRSELERGVTLVESLIHRFCC